MSTLDVVAEILREVAPRALKAREIAALAGSRLPTTSQTPQTVVSRDLAIDVRDRRGASRFARVGRGEFLLKEALPSAFYNDNDAYAAQWTRNLVAAGEIAAGVVDERSIRDLRPADVASYRQFHAFSGLGIWSRALRDAGWPDDVNVWTGSAPCQPWSSAGRRKGHDDERDLWPEWFRLIKACRPAVIFGEQVASGDGVRWFDEGSNLQRMQDREAVVGVLRGLGFQGGPSLAVQGVLQAAAEGMEGPAVEGSTLQGQQAVEAEQSWCSAADDCQVSSEAEGVRIFDRDCGHRRENPSRLLRTDGNSFQSQERQDLGQSVDRQDRFIEGLHEGQCPCGAVLRERDGECLGHGQDRGDCRCDHSSAESEGRGSKDRTGFWQEFGEELEAAPLEESFHSVRSDLEGIGYVVRVFNFPACGIGAPHRRQRLYFVAYARERGREILCAPWLHDRGQRRNDASGCSTVDRGATAVESDAWCSGWTPLAGDSPDRDDGGSSELGDAGGDGAGEYRGELPGDEAEHDERSAPGDHASVAASQADGTAGEDGGGAPRPLVRGADKPSQFRPGDRLRIAGDPTWGGAVGGFWGADVEWIYCRPTPGNEDGCFRPVESGTQPLVDGATQGMGRTRTARLRGYGNAIVRPVAVAFVESVIDAFADAMVAAEQAPVEAP